MEPLTITRTVDLEIHADQLWEALSDPAHLAAWLGDEVHLDVVPGGGGTVLDDGVLRRVRIDRVSKGRELVFTWWHEGQPEVASAVRFAIAQRPDGSSRLEISETFAPDDRGAEVVASSDAARARWGVRAMCLWACTVTAVALVR